MNRQKIVTLLAHPFKGYATATFAITNRCNAKCGFCSIWRQVPARTVPFPRMVMAIQQLHGLGIRYIQFTGGEPLLYRHLAEAIRYASDLGIMSTVVTNGFLISETWAWRLLEADVGEVQISVDHYDPEVLERNRGIEDLSSKIEESVRILKNHQIPVSASTTISKLLLLEKGDYEMVLEYCRRVGFRGVYFCHPMNHLESTYALGGDGALVTYAKNELIQVLTHLVALKRKGYPVDNSIETMEVGLQNLHGNTSKYPCLGGYKTFYIDWDLNLYRCMKKADLIGDLLELDVHDMKLERFECEDCLISCMREPSIYFHGHRSIAPVFRLIARPKYVNLKPRSMEKRRWYAGKKPAR